MPKKQRTETPKQQTERFRAEVERLIEAGELNPTEADERMGRLISSQLRPRPETD